MLAGIIIVFFTMPYHEYPMPKFPITMSKFGNVTVFSIMLCSFAYVMVFGKTLDWFDDPTIRFSSVVCLIFTALFIYLEKTRRSPYFIMEVFQLRVINYGILLFFLLMVCNSSAMFVNVFTNVSMKIDNWQNATLGNWVMVGYTVGLIFAVIARRTNHLQSPPGNTGTQYCRRRTRDAMDRRVSDIPDGLVRPDRKDHRT
jgi:membrane protease YdiL (CAAX protease family)